MAVFTEDSFSLATGCDSGTWSSSLWWAENWYWNLKLSLGDSFSSKDEWLISGHGSTLLESCTDEALRFSLWQVLPFLILQTGTERNEILLTFKYKKEALAEEIRALPEQMHGQESEQPNQTVGDDEPANAKEETHPYINNFTRWPVKNGTETDCQHLQRLLWFPWLHFTTAFISVRTKSVERQFKSFLVPHLIQGVRCRMGGRWNCWISTNGQICQSGGGRLRQCFDKDFVRSWGEAD